MRKIALVFATAVFVPSPGPDSTTAKRLAEQVVSRPGTAPTSGPASGQATGPTSGHHTPGTEPVDPSAPV